MNFRRITLSLLPIIIVANSFTLVSNDITLTSLEELQMFTSESDPLIVENFTIIEPETGPAFPEEEIMKISQRVQKVTGTFTLDGLTQLTTITGLIDKINCSQAGFVFRDCPLLTDMDAFASESHPDIINGNFIIDNCPQVMTGAANAHVGKSFSKIREVKGDFILRNITTMMNKPDKLLPNLQRVEGDFIVENCPRLYYFTNASSTADMPLKYIGGDLILRDNPSLQRLNGFGALEHIGGDVIILDNGGIPVGTTDDEVIGYCKIRYYDFADMLSDTATVLLGRTDNLIDLVSLAPCPYEIVNDVEGTFTATPANRFLESIGVNSSINSRGENIATTIDIMHYIGARWIRASMGGNVQGGSPLPETSGNGAGNSIDTYRQLHEAGIRISAGLGAGGRESNIPVLIDNAKRVVAATSPETLIAIEGNNEPNNGNWYVIYDGEIGGGSGEGKTNWKPVARMQQQLYHDVKADSILGVEGYNYPVWNLTYGGASGENVGLQYLTVPETDMEVPEEFRGTTFADVANLHNYFSHPSFSAPQNNQTWRAATPDSNVPPGVDVLYRHYGLTWLNKYSGYRTDEELRALPRVTTETGVTIGGDVTEEMQGLMYMSLYLAQFARGFDYTAVYLLSDRRDEAGNQSFGIYDKNYTPRLAAHYLHNLTTILEDNENIESPGRLAYSIKGRTVNIHDLLLQKHDGTFELIIWGEYFKGGCDTITVGFDQTYDEIWVYNPVKGTQPEQILKNTMSFKLAMSNHPYIIEIGNHPELSRVKQVDNKHVHINVFPNPATDHITLHADLNEGHIMLHDLFGRCVYDYKGDMNGHFIDMSHFSQGTYILTVANIAETALSKQKIIKVANWD